MTLNGSVLCSHSAVIRKMKLPEAGVRSKVIVPSLNRILASEHKSIYSQASFITSVTVVSDGQFIVHLKQKARNNIDDCCSIRTPDR